MRHIDSRNMRKSNLEQSGDGSNSARWERSGPEVLPGLELTEEPSYPSLSRFQSQVQMWWEGGSAERTQLRLCISEGPSVWPYI